LENSVHSGTGHSFIKLFKHPLFLFFLPPFYGGKKNTIGQQVKNDQSAAGRLTNTCLIGRVRRNTLKKIHADIQRML
jgi:hypothetical protein